ncbi:MAG: hypothetical protein IKD22_07195, partial [Lentisphaeria bacterium]|nr:hypothetical protein [Lentisphaeria bacterium]
MLHFLFCGHDMKFLTPVMDFIANRSDIECRTLLHKGHVMNDLAAAAEANEWADIVFCEWGLGNLVYFSQNKRPGQKLFVRIHAREFRADIPFLKDTVWENVDAAIVICQEGEDYMHQTFGSRVAGKVHLVYNPLDIAANLSCRRLPFAEFNLGFLGLVPWCKRPDLALELFTQCQKDDRRYQLRLKGKQPHEYPWLLNRKDEMVKYSKLNEDIEANTCRDAIHFDGFDSQIGRWYASCGFILSTSDFEGSHQAVAEGMAQGAIPVIRNWYSAAKLYPAEFVYENSEQALEIIRKYRRDPWEYWKCVEKCREYAVENFDRGGILLKYDEIFCQHPGYRSITEIKPRKDLRIALMAYIPAGVHNGYRVRVEQFIRQYREKVSSVSLICLAPPAEEEMLEQHRQEFAAMGCDAHIVTVNEFFSFNMSEKERARIIEACHRILSENAIDVLQVEAIYSGRIGMMLKLEYPEIYFVYDSHGASPEEDRMSGSTEARINFVEDLEEAILENADMVIYVAHAMQTHFMAKFGFMKNSCIVPCCIREEALEEAAAPPAVQLPADRPVLGYVGTMVAWQCKEEMFALFGKLHRLYPDIYFAVLTPESDRPAAQELFDRHGINPADYTLTSLPFEEVHGVLRQFNAGVLLRRQSPVNRAASPTKFGEMIAAGVPVVL